VEHFGDLAGAAQRHTSRVAARYAGLGTETAAVAANLAAAAAAAAPHPLDEEDGDDD
jgi:hypothetical protein